MFEKVKPGEKVCIRTVNEITGLITYTIGNVDRWGNMRGYDIISVWVDDCTQKPFNVKTGLINYRPPYDRLTRIIPLTKEIESNIRISKLQSNLRYSRFKDYCKREDIKKCDGIKQLYNAIDTILKYKVDFKSIELEIAKNDAMMQLHDSVENASKYGIDVEIEN